MAQWAFAILQHLSDYPSLFLWQQGCRQDTIPPGDHQQLLICSGLLRGEAANTVLKRPLSFPDFILRWLIPVAVLNIAGEILEVPAARYARPSRRRGHYHVTRLAFAGSVELLL